MAFVKLRARLHSMSKWRMFGLLVVMAALVAVVASAIVYSTVLNRTNAAPVKIALIAPMSGPDREIGVSMRAGLAQWVADTARQGGPGGHPISLTVLDEATEADPVAKAAADPTVIGVIGPFSAAATSRARPELEAAGLPGLSLATLPPAAGEATDKRALFSLVPAPDQEVRFLANYLRNVLGERLVSIILTDDPENQALADAFDETLQRFGSRVVYRWPVPADPAARGAALAAVTADINQRKVAGTILVLGSPTMAAETVGALRTANIANRVAGLRALATSAFADRVPALGRDELSRGTTLNGTVVTTPVLFDTAGIAAQDFRDHISAATGQTPDWTGVLTYDAATALASTLAHLPGAATIAPGALRGRIRAALSGMTSPDGAIHGLSGPIFFPLDPKDAPLPELVGTYDGTELISAPTQLTPIREQGVSDYLAELTAGRALYVNDRFMYKTNVVYAGIRLEKLLSIDPATNVADLEFVLWFRWRGTLEPQNIVFPNSVTPIVLGAPERDTKTGDVAYRAYRVHGKFFMNYSDEPRRFGTQAVEVLFRHGVLAHNNLMYVTDVLGMGLGGADRGGSESSWLQRLLGLHTETSKLTRQLETGRALAGVNGWLIERAWLSQDLSATAGNGDPVFVGYGKPAPSFSTIGLGVLVKPDTPDIGSVLPRNWLIYISIFGLTMAILAHLLDRKDRGHFWRMQTLLLRIIAWPMLLAAASALALDAAQDDNFTPSTLRAMSMALSMLWWVIPARLLLITIERFVWVPLELTTKRRIPTVFRMIVDTMIYVMAGFGIVAFVLGQTITSLLATSGVLTLIVGLALQSNLRDIISGIMLNLERPFVINDWLRLGRTMGRVIDVSWRTTRLETESGSIVAMPNGKMSDAEIENLSTQHKFEVNTTVMVDPAYPPQLVLDALHRGGVAIPIKCRVRPARFDRIEKIGEGYVAVYITKIEAHDFGTYKHLRNVAMQYLWQELTAAGIRWHMAGAAEPAEALL